MLDGGCDPHYLARRILRMAVEVIGLADPKALSLAVDAWQTYERLGSSKGELGLAETVVYLAMAPKNNAVYAAMKAVNADVREFGTLVVPLHFRNAPTKLMKQFKEKLDALREVRRIARQENTRLLTLPPAFSFGAGCALSPAILFSRVIPKNSSMDYVVST